MKKYFILISIAILVIFSSELVRSQPPDPGGNPVYEEPPLGGSAPVGNGTIVLLVLTLGYAIHKYKLSNYLNQKDKLPSLNAQDGFIRHN